MDQLAQLRRMIDRLLTGELSVPEFERAFALYWYEHVPVAVMRSDAASGHAAVVEKFEFITESPTDSEREDGWIDFGEFVDWLRHERNHLPEVP